jgi:hypothetical protein
MTRHHHTEESKQAERDEIGAELKALCKNYYKERLPSAPKAAAAKRERRLPNQHGRLCKDIALALRHVAGACPSCSEIAGNFGEHGWSPIYRRSHASVTFRCRGCGLQWTVTLANLHKVAKARANLHPWYALVAEGTEFAVKHAAQRRNTITRQPNGHVIRLCNGEHEPS